MELKATVTMTGPIFEGEAPEIVNKNLTAAMYEAVMLLEKKVKQFAPQGVTGAQGGLRAGIKGEVVNKGTPIIKGIVTHQSKYGAVIEKGRTAGSSWPPPGYLIKWIEQKLGIYGTEAKRVEFLVRRKIGKKGFPGVHMFEKAFERNFYEIQGIFERCGFKITRDLNG
jgi:hypothetical protein